MDADSVVDTDDDHALDIQYLMEIPELQTKLLSMPDDSESDKGGSDDETRTRGDLSPTTPNKKTGGLSYQNSPMNVSKETIEDDQYLTAYKKNRKYFKFLLNQSEEVRSEQIVYILNSLKVLCIFLALMDRLGPKLMRIHE